MQAIAISTVDLPDLLIPEITEIGWLKFIVREGICLKGSNFKDFKNFGKLF